MLHVRPREKEKDFAESTVIVATVMLLKETAAKFNFEVIVVSQESN